MVAQGAHAGGAADPVIKPIEQNVEDDDTGIMEVPDSLCMACGESGLTRMIMTKIPFFREVIVSSFECDSCGWANNEVQFGGEIKEKGCRYELKVTDPKDLNRSVIKSDNASIFIPELELEIPAKTQRGTINTIEGVFSAMIDGLKEQQDYRREHAPEVAEKVDAVIARMAMMMTGAELPFTLILQDPAGNSFVENPHAPEPDPHLKVSHFERTPMQDLEVGLQPTEAAREAGYIDDSKPEHKGKSGHSFEGLDRLMAAGRNGTASTEEEKEKLGKQEAIIFCMPCPNCHADGEAVNCVTDIPYFKEVIIMAFTCEQCGYRNNEIKGGGAIPAKGTVSTLRVESKDDFARDVLKSDTAGVIIPDLDLELTAGSLGGFFTSVEGLLQKLRDHLKEGNPFGSGDSAVKHHATGEEASTGQKFRAFMAQLEDLVEGRRFPFTLQLHDPLGNSFIMWHGETPEGDSQLKTEEYERSWDEDEILGLHDIQVEKYETGNEHRYQEPIIADLKAKPHRHGGDHPTPFTKGCDDTTVKPPPAPSSDAQANGGSAAAPSNDDEGDFIPSETFTGRKEGYSFKTGNRGTGYYSDKRA